jgi:hypothetical protein
MALALVVVAAFALLASLALTLLRVGRGASALHAALARSRAARLEALVALDRARERLEAAQAGTKARLAALDGDLVDLARARRRLALLTEAAGEAVRLVRPPR